MSDDEPSRLRAENERLRAEVERLQSRAERLESVGVLAGGIAHDFNNILTALAGSIDLARTRVGRQSETGAMLIEAERACSRAAGLTAQLLSFTRASEPVRALHDLSGSLPGWVDFALRGSNVRHELAIVEGLWPVDIDASQVSQVVHNLVLNADQAMPDGGAIVIQAENVIRSGVREAHEAAPYVRVTVSDRGPGIPPEMRCRIFEPYFTTKPGGSGLGLATSRSIMRTHAGDLTVCSEAERGCTFEMLLPAAELLEPPAPAPKLCLGGAGRVLLMDDDEQLRRIARAIIEALGYQVEVAADGAEAVDRFARAQQLGQGFDAVVLDLTVPGGMGGVETIGRLAALDSEVRVVVSSGYTRDPIMIHPERHGFRAAVSKPYTIETLGVVLNRVIGH